MDFFYNTRILIIDDNVAIHDDFKKILNADLRDESLAKFNDVLFNEKSNAISKIKYEIDTACQGDEGLNLIKKSFDENMPYAMAFIDIVMPPGSNGIDTVKNIWKIDPQLQIALCTAYSDYSWDEIAQQLGISDQLLIIKKPFEAIEIRQIASCLVKKWNLNRQVIYQCEFLDNLVREKIKEKQNSLSIIKKELNELKKQPKNSNED